MVHFADNETLVTSCNALLVKSILMYQEIGECYQSMQHEISNTTLVKADAIVDTVDTMLRESKTNDILIAESLKKLAVFPDSTEDLLGKRATLLHNLSNANKCIVDRAENAKFLLRHEITNMSTNRNAMKGYKPVETDRKNIIRNFF